MLKLYKFSDGGKEYLETWDNEDGTHTSCRRWEAVREGIEDARIIITLQEKLKDPNQQVKVTLVVEIY